MQEGEKIRRTGSFASIATIIWGEGAIIPLTSGSDGPDPLCLFSGSPAGNAMGGLSIAAGILLVINLLTLGVTLRSH